METEMQKTSGTVEIPEIWFYDYKFSRIVKKLNKSAVETKEAKDVIVRKGNEMDDYTIRKALRSCGLDPKTKTDADWFSDRSIKISYTPVRKIKGIV